MTDKNIGSLTVSQYKDFCENLFNFSLEHEKKINEKIASLSPTDFKVWFNDAYSAYHEICFKPIVNWVAQIRGYYNPLTSSDYDLDPIQSNENQIYLKTYKDIFETVFEEKIANLDLVVKKNKDWLDTYQADIKDQALNIKVNDKDFKAIAVCDVLWSGWECDSNAWIVVDDGIKKLVTSDHGTLSFAESSFLDDKISEYKKAIEDSEKLLQLLQN